MDLQARLQSTLGDAYTIERELGGGGMSRVFLARENALGRNVVVKLLGDEIIAGLSSERFAREVRLAASLQHPNIVPVLTTGVADGAPYYTMPYVKGESLRILMKEGALPRRQVISILRDVARALQYAHSEGVVHRDIKPENILLSGDAAVVTDFGIAKAISVAQSPTPDESGGTNPHTLTQPGASLGTPAYMAPEQVAGDTVDQRADLYAWGIIAYELLSGTHPFAGKKSALELLGAQLSQTPAALSVTAPDISPALANVVTRCLQKMPGQRPASAAEILDGLENASGTHDPVSPPATRAKKRGPLMAGVGLVAAVIAIGAYTYTNRQAKSMTPAAGPTGSSVAVLPFADDGADSANAYFGEGIADELMTQLGKVPGLRVASRTSAIALGKRHDLDVREIGRMLGVSTVVEGTVRRAGGQLRVSAQLTNASDGLALWSESYERENKDVFAVQDDITQAIVAALRPELAGGGVSAGRSLKGPGTSNTEAYDLYLRGNYLLERRGPGVAQSADYFSQAIQKDPKFARAYAGLASALEFFPYFAGVPAQKIAARTRAAAETALALDSSLAEPRAALAMVHWHAMQWDSADMQFRRAIAADSTSAAAHTQYGRYLLIVSRIPEAVEQLRTARRLDPLAPTSSVWLSYALAQAGDKSGAMAEAKRARELDPDLVTVRTILVFGVLAAGTIDQARAIAGDMVPPRPTFIGMTANILERTGDKARAATVRKTIDSMPDTTWLIHSTRAIAYVATPDTARALKEMETALDREEILGAMMPFCDRLFDPVRRSARFAAIARRMGLGDPAQAGTCQSLGR